MKRMIAAALVICLSMMSACSERAEPSSRSQETSAPAETSETIPEEPKPTDDQGFYDTTPISQAYLTGDISALDEEQLMVLDRVRDIIDRLITDDMTDYEKELAIHDHIITHCQYDTQALGALGEPSEGADRPYGVLINGNAICSGYTTTFQMFMDILGIECRSIRASTNDGRDHAWNQVKLGDGWYYVDVTWDDPTPDTGESIIVHRYFNVTEREMKKRRTWDSSGLEPATEGEGSYIAHEIYTVNDGNISDLADIMEDSYIQHKGEVYLRLEGEPAEFLFYFDEDKQVPLNEMSGELGEILARFEDTHKSEIRLNCVINVYNNEKILLIMIRQR